MKQITPVSIWYNGQFIQATIFNMVSTNDNLSTNCNFYCQLLTAENLVLSQTNILMEGNDYTTYSSSPDSNEFAYQWGATQLNLTLI